MPVYVHNNQFGPPVNISAFVAAAQAAAAPGGQLPMLGGPGNNLGVNATAAAPIGPVAGVTRAFGLITCASVIYVSTNVAAAAAAWVHHANAGHVGIADVNAAIVALGNPPVASILVIFAHPGAQDAGYNASIATIAAQGIPANNIVEIPNLLVPQFGINNLGMIG